MCTTAAVVVLLIIGDAALAGAEEGKNNKHTDMRSEEMLSHNDLR